MHFTEAELHQAANAGVLASGDLERLLVFLKERQVETGAPEPAVIAFWSFVYSSVLVPALTSFTSTFG